jgi:transcription initiation factor TFIIIB Brf1 subunit/transcription initiation factor TFIIB
MDEFSLLESALKEFNDSIEPDHEHIEDDDFESCPHTEIIDEHGVRSCAMCGHEVKKDVTYEKEWRYYGVDDTRHTSDPNRCQARKVEERSIFKDVDGMGFSDKVVSFANDIYTQVTKEKIYRGNSRKAIIFACIFHAFKILGKPQTCESLQEVFALDRKNILKGMKHVNNNAPKNSEVRTKYITALEIIGEIMEKLNANPEQKAEVVALHDMVKNRSSILNRSKPQSVAAGIVYLYITRTGKKIDIEDYTKIVSLSQLTISKIMKEVDRIVSSVEGESSSRGADE